MTENSDKVPIALVGPDDVEFCSPPAYAAVTVKPSSPARLLKVGAVVLISGAVLLLLGAIGAFYFWKGSDNHIYNVHYTMSINGKLQDGSMEIDAGNNLETFKMGSGAEEAVEVNDFQNAIGDIKPCMDASVDICEPKCHSRPPLWLATINIPFSLLF